MDITNYMDMLGYYDTMNCMSMNNASICCKYAMTYESCDEYV